MKYSNARNALWSYMPVSYLVKQHDAEALCYKFLSQVGRPSDRVEALRDWALEEESTDFKPEKYKPFNGITVEYTPTPPAQAVDHATNLTLKDRERRGNLLLHLDSFEGPGELRARLGLAAVYLSTNQEVYDAPIVGGVTYERMGRILVAVGMRRLEIDKLSKTYEQDIRAYHMAHLALSGQSINTPFVPMAVGLPTDEFITTFSPFYDGRLGQA